eukprot:1377112-Amorphochlora_amoeboformis.AAC.2
MAQILLEAAALINDTETKSKPVRKRARKNGTAPRKTRTKRSRRNSEPPRKTEGRAVELGAWLRSLEMAPAVSVR